MMTPCGMYMKPRRTGGLSALPPGSAHPMDSSSGRDSGSEPFEARATIEGKLVCIGGGWGWNASVQEGITGDDFGDERLHTVLFARNDSIRRSTTISS